MLLIKDGITSFVNGPDGLPLEQITGAGAVHTYYHDQLGSTRVIADSTGTVEDTYAFDANGNLSSSSGSVANPFRYAGQYLDAESSMFYLRAREYDPLSSQFGSRDPMAPITRHPYAYAADSPLNLIDPTGLVMMHPDGGVDHPFTTWTQDVQDLYIRARGQLQALQVRKAAFERDPDHLFTGNPSSYVKHIRQYEVDQNAYRQTLSRLQGLNPGGGQQACDELQVFSDEVVQFDPVSVRGLPPGYRFGGVDGGDIEPEPWPLGPGPIEPEPVVPEDPII